MFYANEIDEEVVEYVRKNPEIMGGVRVGDVIYETKIPYMAKKFLHEKDEKMKRYYACHCGCGDAERLGKVLGRLGFDLEWSDEWTDCGACGRLVRTQANSYGCNVLC
jgi:hypothetical protein